MRVKDIFQYTQDANISMLSVINKLDAIILKDKDVKGLYYQDLAHVIKSAIVGKYGCDVKVKGIEVFRHPSDDADIIIINRAED